ncbi:class I SAM-dependent methyltransferase [Streptomyces sp. NPDC002928]|uniref:class I SAM-dependent methyltransferase n=1 Tax=Streptomyces sp. NPDC002928 TaxID=3154440 RepID=UPI0033B3A45E
MSRTGGRPGLEQAWRHIYDRAYHLDRPPAAPGLDTSGWVNTYTTEPYTQAEMGEWVDETVGRILEHTPRRILEIGCGTGLLGNRLIPQVEAYCGLDFSVGALQRFSRDLEPTTRSTVCLLLASAKQIGRAPRWDYDCVVLNSVLQYFPDAAYVQEVLQQAAALLKPPGVLFLGDVRHRELLTVHHAWREWRAGADDMAVLEARASAARRHRSDREWSIVPADLADMLRSVGAHHVETRLKDGTHPTEMNLFRYDTTGFFGPVRQAVDPEWLDWKPGVERRIDWQAGRPLGLRNVPNARLAPLIAAERGLQDAADATSIGALRTAADSASYDDPLAVLRDAAAAHGAVIRTNWVRDRSGRTVDVAVLPGKESPETGPLLVRWPTTGQADAV